MKGKSNRKAGKRTEIVTTEDEDVQDDLVDVIKSRPKPPRPRPRASRESTVSETEAEHDTFDDDNNPFLDRDPVTPKRPLRPRPANKAKSPARLPSQPPSRAGSQSLGPEGSLSLSEPPTTPEAEPFRTPGTTRKRQHPDDDDEGMTENGLVGENQDLPTPQPATAQETNNKEIQIRRKRVRH